MKPNIFLITIDALRSDYLYRKNGSLHPFMSSLMEEGLVFKNAISPGSSTPSFFVKLFTDLTYFEAKKGGEGNLKDNISKANLLAERFKEAGYTTAGFSNNAYLTRVQGYDKGFDYFHDGLGDNKNKNENENEAENGKGGKILNIKNKFMNKMNEDFEIKFKRGKHVVGPMLSVLNERGYEPFSSLLKRIKDFLEGHPRDKPLFLWAHMMEVHSPYDLPSERFSKIGEKKIPDWEVQWLRHKRYNTKYVDEDYLTEEEMEKIKVLYKCGIRGVDDNLRRFFNYLQEKEFLENGYFTVTADHGENLGDHGRTAHKYIYNSLLKVPLILYDGENKGTVDEVFCNSNLGDLLLDISEGLPINDRLDEYSGIAISERSSNLYSIQDEDYKIIWERDSGKKRYFRLKDGYEEKEIDHNEDISHLESILTAHIKDIKKRLSEKEKIKKSIAKVSL